MKTSFLLILLFAITWRLNASVGELTLEFPGNSSDSISVDFRDSSIFEIINSVSEEFSLDVETPSALEDFSTSIKLRNVGWRTIFYSVLESADYTFLEKESKITIMTQEEFNSLPLVEFVWRFIFISAEEFVAHFEDDLKINSEYNEKLTIKGNTLFVESHPGNLSRWKDALKRSDVPEGLPRYPTIYWPTSLPKSVKTAETSSLFKRELDSMNVRVYNVEWVDPKLLKKKILPYLNGEDVAVRIDSRTRALIISAQGGKIGVIMNICEYLDQRRWYFLSEEPESLGIVDDEAALDHGWLK